MIVTITLNPAIDKTTSVEAMLPDKKLRCSTVTTEAGGGGINVSKALKKLGAESTAIFLSGGNNGKLLEKYLEEQGISTLAIPIEGETRESFTVNEERTHAQYRFVLSGPDIQPGVADSCLRELDNIHPAPKYVVVSGSLPPGISETFFSDVAAWCKKAGARCIVDSSGPALQHAVQQGVFLIKPNLNELCLLSGKKNLQINEVDDVALELVRQGNIKVIVVSLGPSGAMLVTADGYEHIPAPMVKKNTTVGAGDSMVAGMVWQLSRDNNLEDVVRYGVACGSAATMNQGTQLFDPKDVERLYKWIVKSSHHYKLNLD